MPYDPERHHRRSIRLKGYDYSTPGLYVATICIQHRRPLLGAIIDGEMHPTPAAGMVRTVWNEIPWAYPSVEIDAFVVMPNHIHGIVYLLPDDIELDPDSGQEPVLREQGQARGPAPTRVGVDDGNARTAHRRAGNPAPDGIDGVGATPFGCPSPPSPTANESEPAKDDPPRLSLPDVVHRFKSLTTARYRAGVLDLGWEPFPGRLWQRNYYETVIRNRDDLDRYRRYIDENPIRWATDRHNPNNPEIL